MEVGIGLSAVSIRQSAILAAGFAVASATIFYKYGGRISQMVTSGRLATIANPADGKGENWQHQQQMHEVHRIVVTGGPCAGKTSSLSRIRTALEAAGFCVYTVPEVPTIVITAGAAYPGLDAGERLMAFEHAMIDVQMALERSFVSIARSRGNRAVILYDRGLLDISAYLPPDMWRRVMASRGLTASGIASRYDAVLHLVTAADGAEAHYTLANNQARTETPDEACALDQRVRKAWSLHPRHTVIDNLRVKDFAAKLDAVVEAALRICDVLPR